MVTKAAKTKCLLVTGKRIPCKLDECSLELKLVNSEIEQVDSKKILGVTIGKHLSFDVHVEELCKKLSQRIAVLRKIGDSSLLTAHILLQCYDHKSNPVWVNYLVKLLS